jgi:DNA-binding IclR family transcriptional regulator
MDYIARREGDRWPQLRARIERAIEEYAARGFTTAIGEWQKDVNAVGVALTPSDGSPILAFNCGGPSFLLPRERLESEVGPRLVNLVRNVEAALGHG